MLTSLLFLSLGFLVASGQYASEPLYVVEVYFVVEPQVVRNYVNFGYDRETAMSTLRGDIDFFIYQVNQYYESLAERGLFIEIRSKQLDILSDELISSSDVRNERDVKGTRGLASFKTWLAATGAKARIDYDVAVLWTGYDLTSSSGSTSITGYATMRSACHNTRSAAIVEFDGTQSTAQTTAHEIGHTLGASHDLLFSCPPFAGHIMSSTQKVTNKYRWSFSSCTLDRIRNYIATRLDRYNRNCLLVSTTLRDTSFNMSSQMGRDIMDVQKICQREKNDRSMYFCGFDSLYEGHGPRGDRVCQYLYCAPARSKTCSTTLPTEGLKCDVGKRCNKGRCLPAPSYFPAPPVQPECVFGDTLSGRIKGKSGTCAQYLTTEGLYKCYKYSVKQDCCATCEARRIPIPGCDFGDQFPECSGYTPAQICPNNREICCFTCRNFRSKRSELDESQILPKLVFDDDDDDEEEVIRLD